MLGSGATLVLPREATRDLELMESLVAWVPPQQVSGLVRALDGPRKPSAAGNLPGRDRQLSAAISHLKRVHRGLQPPPEAEPGATAKDSTSLAVLLCAGGAESVELLPLAAREVLSTCGATPHVTRVPRHAPLTRAQFDAAARVWPTHFHEAAAAHSLALWASPPAEAELEQMRALMAQAIDLARRSGLEGGRRIAALIVRRDAGGEARVVAACADGVCEGAGATPGGASGVARSPHPLAHALMRCVEEVAASERAAGGKAGAARAPSAGSKRPAGCEGSGPGGDEGSGADGVDGGGSHLCVGCDAYVTAEPCAMCAMAMVHSRVRRVVYAIPSEAHGALGSKYELHATRSLNHHFQVVRGMLQREAIAAGLLPTCVSCASSDVPVSLS